MGGNSDAPKAIDDSARRGVKQRVAVLFGFRPPTPVETGVAPSTPEEEYQVLVTHLSASIAHERLRATRLLLVSMIGAAGAIVWLYKLSQWGLGAIVDAKDKDERYAVTAFLLIRGIAYSALVGGLLFGLFRLARAALDQATRFDKRLIALHFIRFATGAERLSERMLPLVVQVLTAWSATVDSAYTQIDDKRSRSGGTVRLKVGDKEFEVKEAAAD